jgi:hypothetical protein
VGNTSTLGLLNSTQWAAANVPGCWPICAQKIITFLLVAVNHSQYVFGSIMPLKMFTSSCSFLLNYAPDQIFLVSTWCATAAGVALISVCLTGSGGVCSMS